MTKAAVKKWIEESITYKARFEVDDDFFRFWKAAELRQYEIVVDEVLNSEVTFRTNVTLRALQSLMDSIPDCHVLAQTVQPIDRYTGERDFNLFNALNAN